MTQFKELSVTQMQKFLPLVIFKLLSTRCNSCYQLFTFVCLRTVEFISVASGNSFWTLEWNWFLKLTRSRDLTRENTDERRRRDAQRDAWFDNAISHTDWIWEVMELQTFEFGAADVWPCHRKGSVLEDHTIAGGPSKIKGISEELRPFNYYFVFYSNNRQPRWRQILFSDRSGTVAVIFPPSRIHLIANRNSISNLDLGF